MIRPGKFPDSQTTPLPAESAAADATAPASGPSLLDRLLAMANRYQRGGEVRQAAEMYWMLLEDHAGTPQAAAAHTHLLGLAEGYEAEGKQRMARAMYERLM